MTNFQFKTYRCEWQVQLGEIDQYGQNFRPYKVESFATREEALAHLPTVALENPHNHIWVPRNAPHSYCEAQIVYREVEVRPVSA